MPHPPAPLRRRVAAELAILVVLAAGYLTVLPVRPLGMDVGMALVAFGLIGLYARQTNEKVWGPPAAAAFVRTRRCTFMTLAMTVPTVLVLGLYGIIDAWLETHSGWGILKRLFPQHFFVTLLLYIPWALLQQTLFQFYLLGRLRALLPFASPWLLSIFNGILYGAVHLPDWELALLTMAGGVLWSYSYHRDRYVIPIGLSHAVLATTFFYWVRNSDILLKIIKMTN